MGVQFKGKVMSFTTRRWFTHGWPSSWHVVWSIIPLGPGIGKNTRIGWTVESVRQAAGKLKYLIEVQNTTSEDIHIEARFAILNQ